VLETTFHNSPGPSFAVGADGRFLVNKPAAADKPVTQLHVVTNWFDELP